MIYRICGLRPQHFAELFTLDDDRLAKLRSRRETADGGRFPCRVSLQDAEEGEELILTHYTNHEVETPYRNAFAIYVRAAATEAAEFIDAMPPILRKRPIALRGYNAKGLLHRAALALSDDADQVARALLNDPEVAYIDAHNAMHGCFAARIERYGDAS